ELGCQRLEVVEVRDRIFRPRDTWLGSGCLSGNRPHRDRESRDRKNDREPTCGGTKPRTPASCGGAPERAPIEVSRRCHSRLTEASSAWRSRAKRTASSVEAASNAL